MRATIFEAVHVITDEVLIGSAIEIAEQIGVARSTVYKMAIEGRKIGGCWAIAKQGEPIKPRQAQKMAQDKLTEWDIITKPFKEASRRAKNIQVCSIIKADCPYSFSCKECELHRLYEETKELAEKGVAHERIY